MTGHRKRRTPLSAVAIASLVAVGGCARETTGPPAGSPLPASLVFQVQPSFATTGVVISPAVSVAVVDSFGGVVAADTTTIGLALIPGVSGRGLLAGTAARAAVGGTVSFGDLWVDAADSGYTLLASAPGLRGATSARFSIIPTIRSLSASSGGTCALTTQGTPYCSALAVTDWPDSAILNPVPGGISFAAVSAGNYASCGVTANGTAYCWGKGFAYALGNGDTLDHATPVPVAGGLTFTSVATLGPHGCGVTTSGAGYCWGDGPLGDTAVLARTPTPVAGGLTFVSIGTSQDQTCGLTQGGAAYCWGDNRYGELGNGTFLFSYTPVAVTGGLTFSALTVGFDFACGVTSSGATYCWGDNSLGQLGSAASQGQCFGHPCSSVPVAVAGGLALTAVSAGVGHACGLTRGGATYCWGEGPTYGAAPTLVRGVPAFVSISAGYVDACGITVSGVACCWDLYTGSRTRVRLY